MLSIKESLDLVKNNPKIYFICIWRLYPKKNDKFGEYYSTRMSVMCLN